MPKEKMIPHLIFKLEEILELQQFCRSYSEVFKPEKIEAAIGGDKEFQRLRATWQSLRTCKMDSESSLHS